MTTLDEILTAALMAIMNQQGLKEFDLHDDLVDPLIDAGYVIGIEINPEGAEEEIVRVSLKMWGEPDGETLFL